MFTREATKEEIANYNAIEAIIETLNDEEFEQMVETVGDYVFNIESGKETKRLYNKVYRLANKLNTTVKALVDWYCID